MASLSSCALMVGMNVDQGAVQDWLQTAGLAFGALGFFVKEAAPETEID